MNDCCIAVADVLLTAWGTDLMAPFGRRYRTERGFIRAYRKHGCDTLHDAVALAAEQAGALSIDPGTAPREFDLGLTPAAGDGGVIEVPVFYHHGVWRGLTPDGAIYSLEVHAAWRVR